MAEHTRAVLNHLIETCRDSERGFMAAADLVRDSALKASFTSLAAERNRCAEQLLPQAQRLGGDDAADGTTAASVHRRWMDLKARLSGDGDQAVLQEVLRGDAVTLRTYDSALQQILPPTIRELVEAQARDVREAHARLAALQGSLPA